MDAKRDKILELFLEKKRNCEIFTDPRLSGVNLKLIQRTIKRYKDTGTVRIKSDFRHYRPVRTLKVVKNVRERIRREPVQSVRKLSKDLGLSNSSALRICRDDLRLRPYKKRKVHGLTAVHKIARVKKCKHLLWWHAGDEIIFSDEKMFVLQDTHNQQNDRVWSVSLDNIPKDKLAVQRFQNHSSVMVWGAISERGKLPLHFVEKGVKINQDYYIQDVLEAHLLPHAQLMYGKDYFCFQQDSAPAHKAKRTIEWLEKNLPDYISPAEWPASSPDLNPLDFCIWGFMLSKIGSTKNMNLESFKNHLIKIWHDIPMEVVRAACTSFFRRLKVVAQEKGERYELIKKKFNLD